jgi:hypothetical protein
MGIKIPEGICSMGRRIYDQNRDDDKMEIPFLARSSMERISS